MSRTSLHRPRRHRAVSHRTATSTRLLPSLFPSTIPHLNSHYKRCPKALRLRLRSDQSPSRPLYGRSPDKSRHTLSKGHCQVRAPLTRRIPFASSGDDPEHSVMSLPWAIAPFSDSPGATLAGQSEQSDERRLKTNAPYKDSPVAALGEADPRSGGNEYTLPFLRMVEHFWWTGLPQTENFSGLVHIPSEVRGKDSTVVTIGKLRSTNGGHGSPLPSLRVVEHFWWTGLPHTEIFSGLVHIPSEVRGCRRAVPDVKHPLERTPSIGTGVDAFSRNRPGPSITSPSPTFFSPRGACPPKADHSRPRSVIHPRKGRVSAPRGIPYFPTHPLNHVIPMPCEESGVGLPSPLSHPRFSLRHSRLRSRIHSLPISRRPHPGKNQISPKTIKDHACARTSIKTPSPHIQERSSPPP